MSASNYLEAALLDHVFEGSAYTQPTVWVGLSTADPLDTGAGLAEPVDAAYGRVRPADDTGRWQRTDSTTSNKGAITFPEATEDWDEVTHVVLFDAETEGNILASFALTAPRTLVTGDTLVIAVGDLTITLD